MNAVQNRPNAVYAKACFSLRVRLYMSKEVSAIYEEERAVNGNKFK